MAYDFPASPVIGQQFVSGVQVWQWDGIAWNTVPTLIPPVAFDTAPANPYPGQLWWNATNGNLYVWYVDANNAQWVQTAGNTGQNATAEKRNRLINGSMQVSQENGETALTVHGSYPADMWGIFFNGMTSANAQRLSSGQTPSGNKYQIGISAASKPSLAAGDYMFLQHSIEGSEVADFRWGTPDAKQAVFRFAVYATVAGTYTVAVRNSVPDRSGLFEYTITASEINKWVVKEIVIPPDTTGTWPTGAVAGIAIAFITCCGTTLRGVAGWQAGNKIAGPNQVNATGTSFYVSEVGFHRDPDLTGKAPPWEMPNYSDELYRCMRYWAFVPMTVGKVYTATAGASYGTLLVPMRTTPVYTNPGTVNVVNEIGVAARSITTTISISGSWNGVSAAFNMNAGTPPNMINVNPTAFVANARM